MLTLKLVCGVKSAENSSFCGARERRPRGRAATQNEANRGARYARKGFNAPTNWTAIHCRGENQYSLFSLDGTKVESVNTIVKWSIVERLVSSIILCVSSDSVLLVRYHRPSFEHLIVPNQLNKLHQKCNTLTDFSFTKLVICSA